MEFFQAADTGVWHWCWTCSQFPATDRYGGRILEQPTSGLCEECMEREREGRCGTQQEHIGPTSRERRE